MVRPSVCHGVVPHGRHTAVAVEEADPAGGAGLQPAGAAAIDEAVIRPLQADQLFDIDRPVGATHRAAVGDGQPLVRMRLPLALRRQPMRA